jgi:phosphoglycerate kinase
MINISNYNFRNKKALIRVDFNVPLSSNYIVQDDTKITSTIPTIKKILNDGGAAIIISHLGRPKNTYQEEFSLKHLLPCLNKLLDNKVTFCPDITGNKAYEQANNLKPGQILILENLRFNNSETNSDKTFANFLFSLADVYINEAFGTIHRQHTSNFEVPQLFKDKMIGYLMEKEIKNANKIISSPQKPFTLVIGGNKLEDKLPLIEKLSSVTDNVLLGSSMVKFFNDKTNKTLADTLLNSLKEKKIKLFLPLDVRTVNQLNEQQENYEINETKILNANNKIPVDIGPATEHLFAQIIHQSKTILWNGPMGIFEKDAWSNGTLTVAKAMAESTEKGAYSLVGGGDSASALKKWGMLTKFSHVSTGGGAMLYYLSNNTIPVLDVLNNTNSN